MAISLLSSILSMATKLVATIQSSPSSSSSSSSDATMHRVQQDLQELERTLRRIQAVLSDAEEREIRDESIKLWLKELKDVAYDAEDVLDEYQYELLRAQVETRSAAEATRKRKREELQVCDLTSALLDLSIPERIEKIRERFSEIASHRHALHLREVDGSRRPDSSMIPLPTSSHVDESGVFGRDQDKEKLIGMLLSDDKNCNFSVIPIVGMGGLGKTTLAQLVYNDPRVCQYFNCMMAWVCVSENFDVARITREIVESVTRKTCDAGQLNTLQDKLKEAIKDKQVLVVLDDVWNEKQSPWESLRVPFVSADTTRIIVTTRNDSVARVMQTVQAYCPGYLSRDECWLLFQRHAFDGRDPGEHPNLVILGKQIVRKCGQLPLAVKILGGLLRHELEEDKWNDILQSVLWDLDESKNEILPALRLSYHRMPAHVKPCFLYSSLFPKGSRLKKDELIRLWIAHGCIQPRGSKGLEDIGFEYFDELQRRSFFQSAISNLGPRFLMHDMLHDLACSILGNESQTIVLRDDMEACRISNELRHLKVINLQKEETSAGFLPIDKYTNLRTLRVNGRKIRMGLGHQLVNFGHLRVLTFNCLEFSATIGSLKHLRYLCLSSSSILILPESLCQLYNLLTLDLENCNRGVELPRKIGNLAKLRHLLLPRARNACVPPGIAELTDLHELNRFILGRNNWYCGRLNNLQLLVNLRGHLQIEGLENVANIEEAKIAGLKDKERLQSLYLKWGGGCCFHGDFDSCTKGYETSATNDYSQDDENTDFHFGEISKDVERGIFVDSQMPEALLENLRPHTNLMEIKIEGYTGSRFPNWLSDPSFSKLTTVSLVDWSGGCKFLPALGQMPSLKILKITGLLHIKKVGREFSCCLAENTNPIITTKVGFPSLEELHFARLPKWDAWFVADGDFPFLRTLSIMECRTIRNIPSIQSLKSLKIKFCSRLSSLSPQQIHGCPSMLQDLHILDCPHLKSIAGLCNLKSPENLMINTSSQLQFSQESQTSNPQTLESTRQKMLSSVTWLRSLTSLKMLSLVRCPNLQLLPEDSLPPNLEMIDIIDCGKLTFIAGFQNLNSLKRLVLKRCFKLQLSPDESLSSLPTHIEVTDCPGAKEWCERQNLGYTQEDLTLNQLTVPNTRVLTEVSEVDNLPSLEHLCIKACSNLKLFIGKRVPSTVVTLQVCFCRFLQSTYLLRNLSAIKRLTIKGCTMLTSVVGLQNLSSLQQLVICDCPLLPVLPDQWLPSMLQSFVVNGCDELRFLPLLPDNLKELQIWNCSKLKRVAGLGNLTSLQTVTIKQCPKLQLLSSEKLSPRPCYVNIEDCPGLRKWCQGNDISYIQRFNCSEE